MTKIFQKLSRIKKRSERTFDAKNTADVMQLVREEGGYVIEMLPYLIPNTI